jgi:Xaa-Pro aminopeptidase
MPKEHQQRRTKILAKLKPKTLLLLACGHKKRRNGDVDYPFCPSSDFYYVTGFPEAKAMMLLMPGHPKGPFMLFCDDLDPEVTRWEGAGIGHDQAKNKYGADQVFPIEAFRKILTACLQQVEHVYCPLAEEALVTKVRHIMATLQTKERSGVQVASSLNDSADLLHEMRLIKDKTEIAHLRQAAQVTQQGFERMMQTISPGMMEYQLEAEFLYALNHQGVRQVAYPSIVAGGKNACVLHYTANDASLNAGDLVLVDAGAEYARYAADVTRTFPVNGKFLPHQRDLYNAVLAVQTKAIAAVKPGVSLQELNQLAAKEMVKQLLALGLLQGDPKILLQEAAYRQFFMHGLGHWLGLDVHDVGAVKVQAQSRKLLPGMVLTVEPGIYIDAETQGVAKKWLGLGIRIEDDVLVTAKGCEVLTAGIVKEVDAIEALMRAK